MTTELRVVLMTAPTQAQARDMAAIAIEEGLAACANIVPGITSIFQWKGELTEDSEVLVIFKTTESNFAALRERMVDLHPYEVPEVVSLSIEDGNADYLDWVTTSTGSR